jgi:hypothetical protein
MERFTMDAACQPNSFDYIMHDPGMIKLIVGQDPDPSHHVFMEDMFGQKLDPAIFNITNSTNSTSSTNGTEGRRRLAGAEAGVQLEAEGQGGPSPAAGFNAAGAAADAQSQHASSPQARALLRGSTRSLQGRLDYLRERNLRAGGSSGAGTTASATVGGAGDESDAGAAAASVVQAAAKADGKAQLFINLVGQSVVNTMKCENATKEPFLTRHT